MKKIKFCVLAIAALALGACTSDDVVVSESVATNLGGDGYISLAVNLPSQASTRANDVYDDGLAAEYNVNDATLYLFQGTDESTAALYASYSLTGSWATYDPANDNITVKQQVSQQITRPTSGDLYVLVVLNGSGLTNTFVTGATLSSLQQTLASMDVATIASVSGNGNFYMTNAPLWNGSSSGYSAPTGEVQTLVRIDSSKIYDTQAEAEANPATEIYVERGVAKVTVNGQNATSGLSGITVSVDGFCLDLTNLSGYPVRNTTNTQTWWDYASANTAVVGGAYRMVGSVAVAADLYRTYWAVDGNYSTNMYTGGTSGDRTYPETVNSLGGTAPAVSSLTAADGTTGAYCLENTMDVDHMNQDETTRAIVAVTLTVPDADSDGSFYTFEGDKSTLYNKTNICNEVLALYAANGDVENAIENYWIGGELVFSDYYAADIDTSQGATDATVSIAAGTKTFTTDQFSNGVVPDVLNPGTDAFNAVVAQINADNEFSYYAGGVAYYPVLIKHFGDDLTPWSIDDVTGESYPNGAYGASDTAEQDWLGRYGVLRNNWYDITVTAVNNIGSADVPTAYGETDDPIESWISVEINILSWAKRTQDVTL